MPIKEFVALVKDLVDQLGFLINYIGKHGFQEDFFQSSDGRANLLQSLKSFFSNNIKEDPKAAQNQKAKDDKFIEIRFTLQDGLQFLDFWAKTDDNLVYSYTKKEPVKPVKQFLNSNYDLKQSLTESLIQYSYILERAANDIEKRAITEVIKTLSIQLSNIENPNQSQENGSAGAKFHYMPQKVAPKREERREKALVEIFHSYCKQQPVNDNKAMSFSTFANLVYDFNLIRVDEDKNVYISHEPLEITLY